MERLCAEMASIKLDHVKSTRMIHEQQEDEVVLDFGGEKSNETIRVNDLIAIIPAPLENRFVQGDSLVLSIQQRENNDPLSNGSKAREFLLMINVVQTVPASLSSYKLHETPGHLRLPRKDLYVVVSTLSGAQEASNFYNGVLKPALAVCGIRQDAYILRYTISDDSILDLASRVWAPRANEGHPQTVVLLSGDGGVVDAINGILSKPRSAKYVKPTIGLLALGTGNALANSSTLNSDSTIGLTSLLRGSPREVPLFQVRFSPGAVQLVNEGQEQETLQKTDGGVGVMHGAVVASWGLHASLVADSDTPEYRKFGSDRFRMAAETLLAPPDGTEPHKYNGNITIFRRNKEGQIQPERFERRLHYYLLATFMSKLEKTLTISPDSKPLDGCLYLVEFGVLPSDDVMKIFGMAYDGGKHVKDDAVGYSRIEGIHIEFDEVDWRWRRVCIDGKIVNVEEGGWMEVRKATEGAIDLVVID